MYHKPNESQLVAVRGTLKTSKSLTSTSLPSSFAFLQEKSRLNFSSEDKNIYMYFVLSLYNVKTVMYKTKDDAHNIHWWILQPRQIHVQCTQQGALRTSRAATGTETDTCKAKTLG